MADFNKVILAGRFVKNPELTYTPSGTPIVKCGMAINRRYKNGEEQTEESCFIDLVAFGKQAEHIAQYLTKGSAVLVEGRLQQRRWDKDGQHFSKHEVVVESVTFLDKKGD